MNAHKEARSCLQCLYAFSAKIKCHTVVGFLVPNVVLYGSRLVENYALPQYPLHFGGHGGDFSRMQTTGLSLCEMVLQMDECYPPILLFFFVSTGSFQDNISVTLQMPNTTCMTWGFIQDSRGGGRPSLPLRQGSKRHCILRGSRGVRTRRSIALSTEPLAQPPSPTHQRLGTLLDTREGPTPHVPSRDPPWSTFHLPLHQCSSCISHPLRLCPFKGGFQGGVSRGGGGRWVPIDCFHVDWRPLQCQREFAHLLCLCRSFHCLAHFVFPLFTLILVLHPSSTCQSHIAAQSQKQRLYIAHQCSRHHTTDGGGASHQPKLPLALKGSPVNTKAVNWNLPAPAPP